MRPPVDTIQAPVFPQQLEWLNVASLRMDKQIGRPVLVEFWDFCRVSSLRTLPYVRAWHERYVGDGLRVISVHSPGFEPAHDAGAARAAIARLGIEHAVCLDQELRVWREYDNRGWPARYVFDQRGLLVDYHYGEGAYADTELVLQELLGVQREPLAPVRAEDDPAALIATPTADKDGAWSGRYEAGGVWAVLSGEGAVVVNGRGLEVAWPGAHALIEHDRHTHGELDLELGPGVNCHAVCFTPGVVADA